MHYSAYSFLTQEASDAGLFAITDANTGAGVQSFIGDDRFSPILGSTFATIFDQTIQRRIGTQKYEVGGINDQIIYEDGIVAGDRIILEKGGDVIPKVVSVDKSQRNLLCKSIQFITNCPSCNSKLVKLMQLMNYFTIN